MEELYYWIGVVTFWFIGVLGFIVFLLAVIYFILNHLGKRFKTIWVMVEYAFYRKEFKEWVKNKERLSKTKDLNLKSKKRKKDE